MKRQAIGIRSNDEVEQTEVNGGKRIKLLVNETNKDLQVDSTEEESTMDTLNENSHNHHDEQLPSISKNASTSVSDVSLKNDIEHHSPKIVNENGSPDDDSFHQTDTNCNGFCEEVVKVSSDSEIVSESHHSHENSVTYSEENQFSDDKVPVQSTINHSNHEVQNSESTDSFHSEGFEANNCVHESDDVSETCSIQGQNIDPGKESFIESHTQKSSIDLENLTMSHVKVTELTGHADIVFSVAADDDLVLSASGDSTVRVWSVERQSTISTFSGHSDCVMALLLLNQNQSKILKKKLSFTKVSKIAITGSLDCHIKLWSVLEGKELASVYTFNGITCLGYLESECLVVVGTEGGKLELWDISSSKVIKSVHAHEDGVSDIKVKDNYIYSVSIDGTVKVWVYEDDDIYPVYTRKRKEISSDKKGFEPTQWKTVAVSDNVMYLGDNSSNIKALDWRSGRLRLFKNQHEDQGICECLTAEKNMLFSTYYDSSSDTGGINVWKLPELSYVCTLTGAIGNLAVVQKEDKMRIVCGGHELIVWDFDFSRPPNSNPQDEYSVHEVENLGLEIDEKSVDVNAANLSRSTTSMSDESNSNNRWCNVM